ncbi:MAG: glycoside hydrolase family 9 protein [Trueperaceae bacterium]
MLRRIVLLMFLITLLVVAQEDAGPLISSDFEADSNEWELVLTGDAEAESQLNDGKNCVTIANGGRDIFGVQLQRGGFGLVEGETYQVSFEASSSLERPVKVKIGQAASPFQEFWADDLTLTPEAQTFSYSFPITTPKAEAVKMTLFMGGASEESVEVCFDNLTLAEGEIAVGANLLKNADFAEDTAEWQLGAGAFDTEGSVANGEYCAVVTTSGENPWDVALRQAGLNLAEGKKYKLSFDAYADPAATVGVKLGQKVEPFAEYFYQTPELATEKTNYSFDVEILASDPDAQLELFLGGIATPATLCFDNFSLQEVATDIVEEPKPYIMVDQFGYLPDATKVAVLVDPQVGFNADDSFEPSETLEVRSSTDDSVVFSGEISVWNNGEVQETSGDKGWWFDFSSVTEPGSYYIVDPATDTRSYAFDIGDDVYNKVLYAALRMFYYNRANIAKEEPYADPRWVDGESYVGPGQDTEARSIADLENASLAKDLSGGWFDAGDVNKYVTFAEAPVHVLLTSYKENPEAFGDDFNLPESGNGIPDVIDEVKFETDWLKKMQVENGGVIIKMGDTDHNSASPPSTDKDPRFYGPVCSSATIAAAGMFAHAALVYGEFPDLQEDAADLQERAIRAYDWYEANPKRNDCDLGEIKAGDADRSLDHQKAMNSTAAVYLFALTGEERYHRAMKDNYTFTRAFGDKDGSRWSMYDPEQGDALLYYTTLENADPELKEAILEGKVTGVLEGVYGFNDGDDLYRAFLLPDSYHWGSNYIRANAANTNLDFVHYNLDTENLAQYEARAAGMLHYIHGVNPLNLVYLSNMYEDGAENSVNEFYHTWFTDGSPWDNAKTSERGPAPGYMPGGPNAGYTGTVSPPAGEPAQKAYKDWNSGAGFSWEITEGGIYYQAAYVRLLANYVNNK